MRNLQYIVFLLIITIFSCTRQEKAQVQVGNHFGKIQNGLVFIYDDQLATNLRFGWFEAGRYLNEYDDLIKEQYYKGDFEPEGRYANASWWTRNRKVTIEYSKIDNEIVVKLSSNAPVDLVIEAIPSWPEFQMKYTFKNTELLSTDSASGKATYTTLFSREPDKIYSAESIASLTKCITEDSNSTGTHLQNALGLQFQVSKGNPLYFQVNGHNSVAAIDERLALEQRNYQKTKISAKGDWGDFVSPVIANLQHSRAYNFRKKTTATVVSHKWTMWGGQRLFEWDTFFNGLLLSLEDPEAAKEDFRGILAYQQPNGMVPNVACPVSEIAIDRSQPPVGSLCVWKYFLYTADTAFLQEVYPKLLRWNQWWFSTNEQTGLPNRDGNQNGLLEWGTSGESDLGLSNLQLAKYESGQDNSPMFDDVVMNQTSKTMEMDMVGLSSLWAMDALYLSYMAGVLNDHATAKALDSAIVTMRQNINQYLWDPAQNRYADRYWHGKSRKPAKQTALEIPAGWFQPDFKATIYSRQQATSNNVTQISTTGITNEDFDKVEWSGLISVEHDGEYFFYSPVEEGVTLYVDSVKILDNRKSWITEFTSEAVHLKKGKTYKINCTYAGEGPFALKYSTTNRNENTRLFSERFSINCFYPFIAAIPDQQKQTVMLSHLMDTTKFWGAYVCPVIARDDPAFPTQGYWRGRIWPPTNYLLFQGLQQVASKEVIVQYAEKSVRLFMNHWNTTFTCYENWYANGEGSGFPHYTWGALNLLTGVEALFPISNDGRATPQQLDSLKVTIRNLPVMGNKQNLSTSTKL